MSVDVFKVYSRVFKLPSFEVFNVYLLLNILHVFTGRLCEGQTLKDT